MQLRIIKYFIFLMLAGFLHTVWAKDDIPQTNLQMLQKLYFDGFLESLQLTDFPDSASMYFSNSGSNREINWLLTEQFFNTARNCGLEKIYQVNDISGLQSTAYYYVDFRSINQTIAYKSLSTLPNDKRLRTVSIDFFVQLTAPDNQVVFSGSKQKVNADTILVRQIKQVENPEFSFTVGERANSLLSSLLEPVLVTLITGTIIYIFYSFRSK